MSELYLKTLFLQNIATFEQQTIHFVPGFNAIIGETGSGKSLVLEALEVLLGGRAERKLVRYGQDTAVIEGIFALQGDRIKHFCESLGYPVQGDEIILKRIIAKEKTTKNFFNCQSCPLDIITTFSHHFVDLIGQFANQKLLKKDYQLNLVDTFGDHPLENTPYAACWQNYLQLKSVMAKKSEESKGRHATIDYLQFQIKALDGFVPSEEDEENLKHQKDEHQKRQLREQVGQEFLTILSDDNGRDVLGQLQRLQHLWQKNSGLFPSDEHSLLLEATQQLAELSYRLSSKLVVASDDAIEINEILERLDQYQKLKRKWGVTTGELATKIASMQQELDYWREWESEWERLQTEWKECLKQCHHHAELWHKNRCLTADKLSALITQKLHYLNMPQARLEIRLSMTEELAEQGKTQGEFWVELNPGEGIHPLRSVASGGELSRILLACRQVLADAQSESIAVFLFDEIDTGLGGETADKIGQVLLDVGKRAQILAITHLPQIAQYAHQLLIVTKETLAKHDATDEQKRMRTHSSISIMHKINEKKKYLQKMTPLHFS